MFWLQSLRCKAFGVSALKRILFYLANQINALSSDNQAKPTSQIKPYPHEKVERAWIVQATTETN